MPERYPDDPYAQDDSGERRIRPKANLTLSVEALALLDAWAASRGLTRSRAVELLVRQYCEPAV